MSPAAQSQRSNAQVVGAFGEKAVEAELLRRGWIASNVNASVKNAANFDIFALKNDRTVLLRVKTCGPGLKAFQFSFRSAEDIVVSNLSHLDFTVLVDMGVKREEDDFYIVPTGLLRETIRAYRNEYLAKLRRDGKPRKDTGHWTLNLRDLQSGERRMNYGLATRWEPYRNNWGLLEKPI